MAVTIIGTIKTGGAFEVNGRNGKQTLISFTVVDEFANTFACQMWPDDPQHASLAQVIEASRRHQVKCTVVGYTVRMRKFKDGTEKPQSNFIVSEVTIPNVIAPAPAAQPAA